MAIQNKTTTLLGSTAAVTQVVFAPQPDGSTLVTVFGTASDGTNTQTLSPVTASFPAGTAIISNVLTAALSKLRIANGLEV